MSVDIEQLVRDHKKAIHTVDGIEFHTAPGLLHQLREAVLSASGADGAGAGLKSKLPLQAAALDLYMLVDREIAEAWSRARLNRVPGTDSPEALLAAWAAWADDDKPVTLGDRTKPAVEWVARWVRLIEEYFNPPRLAEIDSPCFVCGERWSYRKLDGETVRSSALAFRRDRDTGETLDARCLCCGTVWAKTQFMYLLEQLGKVTADTPK